MNWSACILAVIAVAVLIWVNTHQPEINPDDPEEGEGIW